MTWAATQTVNTLAECSKQALGPASHKEDQMSTLISMQEAARRLAVSYWTLLRWARAGHVASVRLGRRRLFLEEDLQKLVNQARHPLDRNGR